MLPGWPLVLMLQSGPVPPVLKQVQASVLLVRGKLGGIRIRSGSGVVIAPGLVATNAHVAEGTQGLTVHQGPAMWLVSDMRVDRTRDLCLLRVPGLPAPAVMMAPEPSQPGQKVVAVGYPGGHGPVGSEGRLRGVWYLGESPLLQSDAVTLPGSSGGGLFDEEGRLLGLTTQTIAASPRMGFSVPVAWIQELARRPEGVATARPEWSLGDHGADLLEKLAEDPRNWPAWEGAARQWVLDFPQDENAWLALGLTLDRTVRASAGTYSGASQTALPEAVAAYRRSLALRGDPRTWNNLGVDLDLLNRFDEAERAFAEALALEPTYALAWLNLGCARVNAVRYAKAAEAFRKGLALRPDEADAWVRLGYCQGMLGQREAAVATLRIALRYRPLVAEIWLELGLLLVDLARLDEAREVHARLVAMNPELAVRLLARVNRVQSLRSAATKGGVGRERPRPSGLPGAGGKTAAALGGRRRLPTPSKGAQGDGMGQTSTEVLRPRRSRMRPSTSSASSGLSVKSFFTFSAPWPRRLSL